MSWHASAVMRERTGSAPQPTTTAPLGVIEPPAPADAVIV